MILVPMLFIRYIFCMNNEVQTKKGEIKKPSTATMEEKKR